MTNSGALATIPIPIQVTGFMYNDLLFPLDPASSELAPGNSAQMELLAQNVASDVKGCPSKVTVWFENCARYLLSARHIAMARARRDTVPLTPQDTGHPDAPWFSPVADPPTQPQTQTPPSGGSYILSTTDALNLVASPSPAPGLVNLSTPRVHLQSAAAPALAQAQPARLDINYQNTDSHLSDEGNDVEEGEQRVSEERKEFERRIGRVEKIEKTDHPSKFRLKLRPAETEGLAKGGPSAQAQEEGPSDAKGDREQEEGYRWEPEEYGESEIDVEERLSSQPDQTRVADWIEEVREAQEEAHPAPSPEGAVANRTRSRRERQPMPVITHNGPSKRVQRHHDTRHVQLDDEVQMVDEPGPNYQARAERTSRKRARSVLAEDEEPVAGLSTERKAKKARMTPAPSKPQRKDGGGAGRRGRGRGRGAA